MRSFLMERLAPGGVDPKVLLARLDEEKDVSVKRAILLSLGEFGLDRLSLAERRNHLPRCCNCIGTTLILGFTEPPNGCCGSGRHRMK